MLNFLETLIASIWNRMQGRRGNRVESHGVTIGFEVAEGSVTQRRYLAILGKTGGGKSFACRLLALADIRAGRGFLYFDQHGDTAPFLLAAIAEQEIKLQKQLHDKLIYISPADEEFSVGLNPLEQRQASFVSAAELSELLERRWKLQLGARTDELLRNSLYVLSANGLTLVELALLLTSAGFRANCLNNTPNAEVRHFFELRYDKASEAMQGVMREPILNKVSAFTADPNFRYIIGQRKSTFSISEAMDRGCWIIVNIPKGQLGEQSITLGSLIFTLAKNALFSRKKRNLFSDYVDEVQNFLAYDTGIETVLSEARKFGVSVITANQFLGQHTDETRAAILSVGTLIFFQLAPGDATQVAQALDGGKPLAERLKNLPHRHFVIKSGSDHWREGYTPTISEPKADFTDLLNRARAFYARPRVAVEQEISARHAKLAQTSDEVLHEWE
jgi:hypothetical protein